VLVGRNDWPAQERVVRAQVEGRRLPGQPDSCYPRSIVQNVIGVCKTESSQKPVPAHDDLVEALRKMAGPDAVSVVRELGVCKSGESGADGPTWRSKSCDTISFLLREKLGITKRIGWHNLSAYLFPHFFDLLARN